MFKFAAGKIIAAGSSITHNWICKLVKVLFLTEKVLYIEIKVLSLYINLKQKDMEKIIMNVLDWGKSTEERNNNLSIYHGLKTENEKQTFLSKLKVKRQKIHINGFEYWIDVSKPDRIFFYDGEHYENGISIEDPSWTKDEIRQLKALLKEKFNINSFVG